MVKCPTVKNPLTFRTRVSSVAQPRTLFIVPAYLDYNHITLDIVDDDIASIIFSLLKLNILFVKSMVKIIA